MWRTLYSRLITDPLIFPKTISIVICDLDQNMLQSKYNIHSTIILLQITWVVKLALIMTRRHLCKYYRSALSHTHREIFELQRQQQFIRWPSCRHKRPLARTKSVLSTCLALISLATWPVLACGVVTCICQSCASHHLVPFVRYWCCCCTISCWIFEDLAESC